MLWERVESITRGGTRAVTGSSIAGSSDGGGSFGRGGFSDSIPALGRPFRSTSRSVDAARPITGGGPSAARRSRFAA
eukprot:268839-Chlamydomonas_euryale.AAC.1